MESAKTLIQFELIRAKIDAKHKDYIEGFCQFNRIERESAIENLYALLAVIFAEGELSGAKRMREIDERKFAS